MNRIHLAGATIALGLSVSATSALACNPFFHSPNMKVSPQAAEIVARAKDDGSMTSDTPPSERTIVGMWHTVHSDSSGTPFLETIDQWHEDGTELEYANLPPAVGPTCLGVWQKVGPYSAQLYHTTFFYSPQGDFQGTMQLRATYKVGRDGNTYQGAFEEKDYDPKGKLMADTTGSVHAVRIVPTQ